MCESGTNTTGAINTLRRNLIYFIQEHTHIWLHVWVAACDLTQMDSSTKYSTLKSFESNTIIQKLKSEFDLICEIFNHHPGNKITFLGLPFYPIVKWNSVHNHKEPSSFQEQDIALENQIIQLNSEIKKISVINQLSHLILILIYIEN